MLAPVSTETHYWKAEVSESPTTDRAVERKLRVHALFRMPDLVGQVPGLAGTTVDTGIARVDRRPAVQVRAVYHDTEDLRLIRWGVTLRRRAGGADEGWHLTLPGEGPRPAPTTRCACPWMPASRARSRPRWPTW